MSTGIYLPNNKSSSTPDFHFHQLSANLQENNRNNSTVSELPPEYYSYLITEIQSLKASVGDLKRYLIHLKFSLTNQFCCNACV